MQKKSAARTAVCILTALALLFLSRMPGLMHNAFLHPDEPVFIISARNLTNFLLGSAESYNPTKYYPEGGFVLHMPFQLVGLLFGLGEAENQLIGRFAGCTYFLLGAALGATVLRKYFTKDNLTTAIYLATLFFGLMHIEQSRYATGDTASFFFLMLLILFSAKGMETESLPYFLLAAAVDGCLAAIKYPLAFFVLIPLLGFLKNYHGCEKKQLSKGIWKAVGCFLIGFLLLSPRTLTNPAYLFWTAAHETHNYMAGTNLTEVGGPVNHLISMVLYTLMYSGIPLATGAAIWHFGKAAVPARKASGCEYLFSFVIPVITAGFFLYNLFVTALFMRTYYPFFCILDLYCAVLCGKWFREKGWKKIAVVILFCALCLRGGYYLHILSTDDSAARAQAFMARIDPDSYDSVTELRPGKLAFHAEYTPKEITLVDLKDPRFTSSDTIGLRSGELLVSTYQEYGISTPYYLPITNKAVREYISIWTQFKEANGQYELGFLYPKHYYTLFGFWIKGTTGMYLEFPANSFYLNPKK